MHNGEILKLFFFIVFLVLLLTACQPAQQAPCTNPVNPAQQCVDVCKQMSGPYAIDPCIQKCADGLIADTKK